MICFEIKYFFTGFLFVNHLLFLMPQVAHCVFNQTSSRLSRPLIDDYINPKTSFRTIFNVRIKTSPIYHKYVLNKEVVTLKNWQKDRFRPITTITKSSVSANFKVDQDESCLKQRVYKKITTTFHYLLQNINVALYEGFQSISQQMYHFDEKVRQILQEEPHLNKKETYLKALIKTDLVNYSDKLFDSLFQDQIWTFLNSDHCNEDISLCLISSKQLNYLEKIIDLTKKDYLNSLYHSYVTDARGNQIQLISATALTNVDRERSVFVESFQNNYKDLKPESLNSNFKTKQDFTKSLNESFDEEIEALRNNKCYMIRAFEKDTLIGWVTFNEEPSETKAIYIRKLLVAPDYQRNGIGMHLLFSALNTGIFPDTESIFLMTRRLNKKALPFYKKNGFVESSYLHEGYNRENYIGLKWCKK